MASLDRTLRKDLEKTVKQARRVAVSQMSSLSTSLYDGDLFDENTAVIIPKDADHLGAIYSFCRSDEFRSEVKKIDGSSLKIPNLTMLKVPFDLDKWQADFDESFGNDLPVPDSTDPSQWLFSGDPKESDNPLQVGVARLTGFLWPRQTETHLKGCRPANGDGLTEHVDADGIVCLTATKGEEPAHERLTGLLATAFGPDWSAAKLASLLVETGYVGKSLDDWLRDGFFEQHCGLFQQRPFIWHIWDGRRDGFHALVNYHRLASKGRTRHMRAVRGWPALRRRCNPA